MQADLTSPNRGGPRLDDSTRFRCISASLGDRLSACRLALSSPTGLPGEAAAVRVMAPRPGRGRTVLLLAAALAAAAVMGACSSDPPRRKNLPPFNLLLITLDTTRADRLG